MRARNGIRGRLCSRYQIVANGRGAATIPTAGPAGGQRLVALALVMLAGGTGNQGHSVFHLCIHPRR